MKEHIRAYGEKIIREVQLATIIAVGTTAVAALGLKEWRAARAEETTALEAKKANDNRVTDQAYKDAWIRRMDAENDLTPEEEDQIQPGE